MESMSWWLKLRGYLGQLAKTAHSERRARKHAQKTSQRDGRRTNRDYSKIDEFGWLYSCTLVHQRYNYTYKATAQPTSVLSDATGPTECCRLVDSHFVTAYSMILEFLTTILQWDDHTVGYCWMKWQLRSSRIILLTEGWPEVGMGFVVL